MKRKHHNIIPMSLERVASFYPHIRSYWMPHVTQW